MKELPDQRRAECPKMWKDICHFVCDSYTWKIDDRTVNLAAFAAHSRFLFLFFLPLLFL